jgi:hypothetical protein
MRDMNWRVCEGYTHSDHQAIRFSIGQEHHAKTRRLRTRERKWKTKAFNKDLFVEALRPDSETWNPSADELTDALVRACDITMPRKVEPSNRRRPAYWWNEQISTLRADCLRARRHFQRAKSAAEREVRRVVFRIARSALKREITLSKSNCYKELCCKAESSPWGDAFRIVMAKTKGPVTTTELCSEKLRIIVAGLFPRGQLRSTPM